MCPRRAHKAGFLAVALALGLSAGAARAQDQLRSSIEIERQLPPSVSLTEQLQLEAFINGRATNLIAAFLRRPDGALESLPSELDQIGLRVPARLAAEKKPVPLTLLPGVTYRYDEPSQSIYFTATPDAEKPNVIDGRATSASSPAPQRPPLGAVLNYTLFANAEHDRFGGARFSGVSGAFEARVFGPFGMIENGVIVRAQGQGTGSSVIRLETRFIRENPANLTTIQAGDLVSGGFGWTRPIRMAGLQYRRSFELRPDLITIPVPTLSGTAAATSTLDLYINSVRAVSAQVPAGPYQIDHPPVVYGGGTAQVVVRDALGRETVSSTPFYASPQMLAPGLSDFSAELGLARRNYAVRSNDYDGRIAGSISWRQGISQSLTLQGHGEFVGHYAGVGAGAVTSVGGWGLGSVAIAASRSGSHIGALAAATFESRQRWFSLLVRAQRTFGDYRDQASVTAARPTYGPGVPAIDPRVYGPPRSLYQATLSMPLPWRGGQIGGSVVQTRGIDDSRIASVSFTQNIGRFSLYASGVRDFEVRHSTGFFMGLSMPLGAQINASAGASRSRGATNSYVEASRQGFHGPGGFGWTVRASGGDRQEIDAAARYITSFARFEATSVYYAGKLSATASMEGAIALVGGGVHLAQRLDQSFALVKVGAKGVAISRENRLVGYTGRGGTLLVPELAAWSANRIALDPSGLPLDADVSRTSATATPYARQPTMIDMTVKIDTGAALLTIARPDGALVPLGSQVMLDGTPAPYTVGYDGQAYLEGLKGFNKITVVAPTGERCGTSFAFKPLPGRQMRLALTCASL